MPLILERAGSGGRNCGENESRWLDPSLKKPDIERFFQPFDTSRMDAYPVSGDFLKKSPGDASIIEPAT